MNFLDIILVIPLLWGGYHGFRKGIVREVSTLFALFLGIYGALNFATHLESFFSSFEIDKAFVPLISFAVVFLAIVVFVNILGRILDRLTKMVALGPFTKLLGAAFGLTKYLVIISAILYFFNPIERELKIIQKQDKTESLLYRPISSIFPHLLPDEQERKMLMKDVKKAWKKTEQSIPK